MKMDGKGKRERVRRESDPRIDFPMIYERSYYWVECFVLLNVGYAGGIVSFWIWIRQPAWGGIVLALWLLVLSAILVSRLVGRR
jgi:hypothetical protein